MFVLRGVGGFFGDGTDLHFSDVVEVSGSCGNGGDSDR